MKNKYITTPIYYVNDVPHIGHAYSTTISDVIARYWRLRGNDVFFLTGTDEHGINIQRAADKNNQKPQEYVDSIYPVFVKTWETFDISNDYFIRTTNPEHEKYVNEMLKKIYDNGFIYKGTYKGLYCTGCEKYITEDDVVDDVCPLHPNKKLEELSEDNWFFKLSAFESQLKGLVETDKLHIYPHTRKNEVLGKLNKGLQDISVSRAGVDWGIPLSWDASQTIYVWVDALINYYSALKINGKFEVFWPATLHLVGKDILWFHSVIWPALLLACGEKLPEGVFAHGFFTIAGQKMSKSLGNVISPAQLIERYGVDGARYLLCSATRLGEDGDISLERFDTTYNSVLANGIGNLVSRTAKLASSGDFSFPAGQIPDFDITELDRRFESYEVDLALEYVMGEFNKLNHLIDENKPWLLIKEGKNDEAELVLSKLVASIRQLAPLLAPFMPNFSEKIILHFSTERIEPITPLFPRI